MQLATLLFAPPLSLAAPPARAGRVAAVTTLSAGAPSAGSSPKRQPLKPARKRVRSRNLRTGPSNHKWLRVQPGAADAFGPVPGEDVPRLPSLRGVTDELSGPSHVSAAVASAGGRQPGNRKSKGGRKVRNGRARALAKPERVPVASAPTDVPSASDLRPESCPALVLNADFSPLSYMPLSLWPWQEVVKAVFLERVTVVATYDVGVRSPGMLFPLPSVISLKEYQPMAVKKPAFTRFNVFLRDGFACQYCGSRYPTHELTFDHVVPRCAGGHTNWKNVVTACVACNHAKGRYLLKELKGFKLRREPRPPTNIELQQSARKFPPQYLHETWRDYVYWSQSIEEN